MTLFTFMSVSDIYYELFRHLLSTVRKALAEPKLRLQQQTLRP